MAEDDVSRASRESDPPSFDIDDEAIAALLDSFVETQAGNLAEPTSRPPDPSDSGALAAQRTVFEHRLRHEALPLVGDTPDTMKRRIALLPQGSSASDSESTTPPGAITAKPSRPTRATSSSCVRSDGSPCGTATGRPRQTPSKKKPHWS
jgi:hypothetical protein